MIFFAASTLIPPPGNRFCNSRLKLFSFSLTHREPNFARATKKHFAGKWASRQNEKLFWQLPNVISIWIFLSLAGCSGAPSNYTIMLGWCHKEGRNAMIAGWNGQNVSGCRTELLITNCFPFGSVFPTLKLRELPCEGDTRMWTLIYDACVINNLI